MVVGSMLVMRWLKSPAAIVMAVDFDLAEAAEGQRHEPAGEQRPRDDRDEREDAVDAEVAS